MNLQQKIATSFSKAALTYDQSTQSLQYKVGLNLLQDIHNKINLDSQTKIVDLGCGTGKLSHQAALLFPYSSLLGLDIAPDMLEFAAYKHGHDNITWLCGAIEDLSLPQNSVDLVYSNFTLQWCDLHRVLARTSMCLKKRAMMVFNLVVNPSLYELEQVWQVVDSYQHINKFQSQQDILATIAQQSFTVIKTKSIKVTMEYATVKSILKSVHNIGSVNLSLNSRQGLLSREKLLHLEESYAKYRLKNNSLPLSYTIFEVWLQKK